MTLESFHDLMRLAHGFEAAKIFFVANDLDLFSRVGQGRAADDLAAELGRDGRALTILLNALVAVGLLQKEGDLYRNGPAASRWLVQGEAFRGSIFKHIHHCWGAWNDLGEVIRDGRPARPREEAILGTKEEWTRDFIRGMDDVTRELAPQVARKLDLSRAKVVLDVGGGPGTYASAFLDAHPHLEEVRLFDLPGALAVGRERLAAQGLLERVRLVEGDFCRDELGSGVDFVWISQVFHSQDEPGCRMLIEKAWRALNPGGTLAVHEFLLDEGMTSPLNAALFSVHMLVMTEGGRAYGGAEVAAWMAEQGFEAPEILPAGPETGMVLARKP
ncbi:methyltransferase [uncultured Desulfuromonas sp.]|uniref:methyltransferase n=1 Tax=uncultured Desulfuromonas sp. TaxID=181013 RepID=UPI002602E2E4|nr:methyltransferase [uncultured Desulfuromonas sp.]